VRVYEEELDGVIRTVNYVVPSGTNQVATDFVNQPSLTLRGIEYQLKGQLWTGGRFTFGQNHLRNDSSDPTLQLAAPHRTTNFALFQRVANDIDVSLMASLTSPVVWKYQEIKSSRRIDFRLAKPIPTKFGKSELALVIQNIGPANQDYSPHYLSKRQAFVTWQSQF
jgi:hypothetical protein